MKKLYALITILALLLPVITGCQGATPPIENNAITTTATTEAVSADTLPAETTPPETTAATEPATKISREEALAIALEDAGLKENQITDLDIELDRDNGTVHYDVDFEKDNKDYDYEIDAESGDILRKEVPKAPATPTASTSGNSSSTEKKQLTKTEARNIALKHAGLSVSQVRDLEVELDKDDGTTHYDVDFEADGYDYDYEIEAKSGKILKSQKERD